MKYQIKNSQDSKVQKNKSLKTEDDPLTVLKLNPYTPPAVDKSKT